MSSELNKIFNAFTLIRETSSRLEKDKLMKSLLRDRKVESLLREILIYTFHTYWNYWVKVPSSTYSGLDSTMFAVKNDSWKTLKSILDDLRKRKVTGNQARTFIENFLEEAPPEAVPWFIQIINRDIKIGMQLKSFEKHFGELVPKVGAMLATDWGGHSLKEKCYLEPKIDGLRCFVIFDKEGNATAISRNGRPVYNMEAIIEDLENENNVVNGIVLDGEVYNSNWGGAASAVHSKNKKVKGLQYYIFDMLTIEEWEKKKCSRTQVQRREGLCETINNDTDLVKLIPFIKSHGGSKDIKAYGLAQIDKGLEGCIVKPLSGKYTFKRSADWMKYKYKTTGDFKVVGRIEGQHRNKGKLGALIVEGKVEGVKIRSEVGQGLKDTDREYFWKLSKDELKQQIVEVEHYGTTAGLRLKASDTLPALRNGIFLRIRTDKMER